MTTHNPAPTTAIPDTGRAAPALVMLHGITGDGRSHFGHLADRFADHRHVVLPDYAGSGTSTIPDGPLSVERLVDEVTAAIRQSSSIPADLVGYSLGAVVAAATTATHPEMVRRLVLVAGWPTSNDPRHQLLFHTWAKLEATDTKLSARLAPLLAFDATFLSGLGHEGLAEILPDALPAATARQLDLTRRVDIRDQLGRIAVPTLVIGCTRDNLVPVDHARALHDAIPGSRYAEIDSGHAVMFEQPDALTELIDEFLRRPERP